MRSEGDPRLKAAKDWLQSELEDVFAKTSFDCHDRLKELDYPPATTGEGDPIVRDAIRQWRKKSLECIPEGFTRFFELVRQSQPDAEDLADTAKNFTWEAIDEVFNWRPEDRSSSIRFDEWRTRAGVDFGVDGVLVASSECNVRTSLADRLSCDFRIQFEGLLDRLRNRALSDIRSAKSTGTGTFSELATADAQNVFVHSEDYRSITVKGEKYNLTKNQALIVKKLHDAYVKTLGSVSTTVLLTSIEAPRSRLRDSFRSGDGRKVWQKLIRQPRRGAYALRLPQR